MRRKVRNLTAFLLALVLILGSMPLTYAAGYSITVNAPTGNDLPYCHAVNTLKHVTEMVEGISEPLRQLCRRQFLLQMLCNIVPALSHVLFVTHSLHHLGLYFITYLPHLLFRSCEVPMNGQSFSRPRSV